MTEAYDEGQKIAQKKAKEEADVEASLPNKHSKEIYSGILSRHSSLYFLRTARRPKILQILGLGKKSMDSVKKPVAVQSKFNNGNRVSGAFNGCNVTQGSNRYFSILSPLHLTLFTHIM
jgi:hypothetical protein